MKYRIAFLVTILSWMTLSTLEAQVSQPPITVQAINSVYFVDGIKYKNIQSAVNAASTSGAVIIPPNYGGSDTFTNTDGILVLDFRGGKLTISNPGVFNDNVNPHLYISSNLNNCNVNWIRTEEGGGASTDAVSGCVNVPSSSSVVGSNAVAGYVTSASPSTGCGVSGTCPTAGYFNASAAANGTLLWGINPVCSDQSYNGSSFVTYTNVHCQNEFDQRVTSNSTTGYGLALTGHASVSNHNMIGLDIEGLAGPYPVWWIGMRCFKGATGSGKCLSIDPAASGNNQYSQQIVFNSVDSGGTPKSGIILQDPSGNFLIQPGAHAFRFGSDGIFTPPGNISLVPLAPGNNQYSNHISFSSTNSSGGNQAGTIVQDPNGNIDLRAGSSTFGVNANGDLLIPGNAHAGGYIASGQNGFTGTKTAGACVLTITGGIITNVTGC